jgi:Fic family protein
MLYTTKKYEIQATTYQIGILLLFNLQESYTFEELANSTNLTEFELKRTLDTLVNYKLLKKSTPQQTQNLSDVSYTLNLSFSR